MKAIVGVGGKLPLPEGLWNYAEHGAAVEVISTISNYGEFEIAERGTVQMDAPVMTGV
jgi:hypothetical protein